MPKVTFIKNDKKTVVEAEEGKSLLEVAQANDINLDHACGGNGGCTTCMCQIHEGSDNLGEMTDQEDIMGMDMDDNTTRLGCQTKVEGDATVEPAF